LTRIHRLQESLKAEGIDSFFIHDPVNLFYYTGHEMSAGKLLVDQESALLIVDGRYIEAVSDGEVDARLLTDDWLKKYAKGGVTSLGFDSRLVDYDLYEQLGVAGLDLRPMPGHLMRQRMVKEEAEIEILRKAANLAARGYDHLLSLLEEGVREIDLARQLEIFWLKSGGEKLSFDPIIAFGVASAMPHYHTGEAALEISQPALFDIGVQFGHYQSDMTRVRFVGSPEPKMEAVYQVVKEAFEAAVSICKPGVSCGELDAMARETITAAGYGENFNHSLGHGVGLEVHELPVLRSGSVHSEMRLEAGMVITVEPGVYLPGVGGVRLEDTLLVTESGCESLTKRPM